MKKLVEKLEKLDNWIRPFYFLTFLIFGIFSVLNYFYFILPLLNGISEDKGIMSIIPIGTEYLLFMLTLLSAISIFTKLKIFGWYDVFDNLVYRGFLSQRGFLYSLIIGFVIDLISGVILFFLFKNDITIFAKVFCSLSFFVFCICFIWGMLEEFEIVPYE